MDAVGSTRDNLTAASMAKTMSYQDVSPFIAVAEEEQMNER